MSTPEENARAEAEARRARILNASRDRMNVVEGTIKKEDEVEQAPVSASASARMAAMRRRRFKKKEEASKAAEATTTTTESAEAEATTTTSETTETSPKEKESNNDRPAEETKEESSPAPAETPTEAPKKEEEKKEPVEQPVPSATAPKKYQGVAKMRRRMVKERQAKEQDQSSQKTKEEEEALRKVKDKALKSAKRQLEPPKLPIYMTVVTIFLLFLAGLDVGLDQSAMDYGQEKELLKIHTELAPRQLGRRFDGGIGSFMDGGSKQQKEELQDKFGEDDAHVELDHDEFSEVKKDGGDDTPDNLDPLFGVDLDKLTAGDGLYYTAARFAVWCHRLNLSFFYYLPKRIFTGLVNGIWKLIDSPPLFCLVAIVVRQLIGKMLLGAKLPAAKVEEEKDVLSMAKQFIGKFVLRSFPTAVSMYDAWTHLRADMYVVVCGFLVGVAWSHAAPGGFLAGWQVDQQGTPVQQEQAPAKDYADGEL